MRKKQVSAAQIILASLLLSLFAVSCFRPSAPPAEITARVIISEKLESSTPIPTPPSNYSYWIVKLSIKNLAYKDPIEVSREAFYNSGGWTTAQRNTNYSIYIYAFSESGRVPVGQSGEFTALFYAPTALPVGDCQIAYLAQQPTSYTTLSLEDKILAYDWDTKTVTARLPSHDNLVVAILVCLLLAAVRWYPDVRRIIRRDSGVKSDTRIMETSFDKKLNHAILAILVIIVVGVMAYYLYPSIGYKALIPAIVIAAIYIVCRWIRSRSLEARIREVARLEQEKERMAQEQLRIEQEKKDSEKEKKARELLEESEKAIVLNPDNTVAWQDKGSALMDLGKSKEALEAYEKAIELDPDNADLWKNKGSLLKKSCRYKEALQAYEKAIELDPDDADLWKNKGSLLKGSVRYKEAVQAYEKAIVLNPKDADAWYWKGVVLDHLGMYKYGLEALEKAIALNPKMGSAWRCKGSALNSLGRHKEALKASEKAIVLNPKDTDAWCLKCSVLDNLYRYAEALQAVENAIAIEPYDAYSWRTKGLILSKLGMHKEELEAYDTAVRLEVSIAVSTNEAGSQWELEDYEDYYWQLPVYGLGEEGMKTSEFAEIIMEDSKVARRILESWRALGRATRRPSGREYKWWQKET